MREERQLTAAFSSARVNLKTHITVVMFGGLEVSEVERVGAGLVGAGSVYVAGGLLVGGVVGGAGREAVQQPGAGERLLGSDGSSMSRLYMSEQLLELPPLLLETVVVQAVGAAVQAGEADGRYPVLLCRPGLACLSGLGLCGVTNITIT